MTANETFYRLAPFIQEFIRRNHWEDLRDIQQQAIPLILDTEGHVLIMSSTASGKTEAALLPILTLLDQSPPQSIGVLYIGPLKALINDQFERVQLMVQDRPDIPIQGWHGDVSQAQKRRFLRHPRGILQITPESLEAMLINRSGELTTLFGDLRFVIIDEIHAFLGTTRGQQVQCQLQRLSKYTKRPVRRIGLSATIGDIAIALRWLEAKTPLHAIPVREVESHRSIKLDLHHVVVSLQGRTFDAMMAPENMTQPPSQQTIPTPFTHEDVTHMVLDERMTLQQDDTAYYDMLFDMTLQGDKIILFANQRAATERIAAEMRKRLSHRHPGGQDRYFVHHGDIAANLREFAENAMRAEDQPACTIATATLELGIDIGHLDRVIQVGAPYTVSNFVQRLGRSGRRGSPPHMCFFLPEYLRSEQKQSPLDHIPWKLLQTLAMMLLYLEDRWIEPPEIPQMPLSLLYQQTMSIMKAQTEMSPLNLARSVLTLAPFRTISDDEYRLFLQQLIAHDHLARMDEGNLIVGMKGERITSHFSFYAIFATDQDYRVISATQEIGQVQRLPSLQSVIGLAGYAWLVIGIDERRRTIHVERAHGKVKASWQSFGNHHLHERVLQRMRQVLREEDDYSSFEDLTLTTPTLQRLAMARKLARDSGWLGDQIVSLGFGHFVVFPWANSRICRTLVDILRYAKWNVRDEGSPFYLEIIHSGDVTDVLYDFHMLGQTPIDPAVLVIDCPLNELRQGKYDYLAPRALLERAYMTDVLDISGALDWLAMCR